MSVRVLTKRTGLPAPPLFAYQHTPVEVTGVTSLVTVFSVVIPGGTLGPNGVLWVQPLWSASANNANGKSIYVKYGTATITGLPMAGILSYQHVAILRNRNAVNSQVFGPQGGGALYGGSTSANQIAVIDTSVDQTLVCQVQLASPTITKSVSSITRTGQTATATATAHGYANGQSVLMAGANQTEYNGTFVISNVTANAFDYTVTGTPATPATGTITAALWDIVTLESVDVEVLS